MRKNCYNCVNYDGDKRFGICKLNSYSMHALECCTSFMQDTQKKGQNQADTNRLFEINVQIRQLTDEANEIRVYCTHEHEDGESSVYDCESHVTCSICHQSW